jgi:hypothetical protein
MVGWDDNESVLSRFAFRKLPQLTAISVVVGEGPGGSAMIQWIDT